MSVAAMQFDKFCVDVAQKKRAYTFTHEDELLVYPVHGEEVVPFWSSRTRLLKIVREHPKYAEFTITEYTLAEFQEHLNQMESESIKVGVNWSGTRLLGYNVTVKELRASFCARAESAV